MSKLFCRYLPDQSLPWASVEQNAEAGTSVAAVTVTDKDRGKHGETRVEIVRSQTSGGSFGERNFDLQTYGGGSLNVLRVAALAKFETGDVYNLTLKATDFGTPPRSSVATLTIKVL